MISPETWTHIQMLATTVIPLGSGIAWLLRRQERLISTQARMELKVDTIWDWYTNHGSDITGYNKTPKP